MIRGLNGFYTWHLSFPFCRDIRCGSSWLLTLRLPWLPHTMGCALSSPSSLRSLLSRILLSLMKNPSEFSQQLAFTPWDSGCRLSANWGRKVSPHWLPGPRETSVVDGQYVLTDDTTKREKGEGDLMSAQDPTLQRKYATKTPRTAYGLLLDTFS